MDSIEQHVSIKDFPQELVDEVIDRMSPDTMKESLRALSLVAQSFRPRCQKRLFAALTVNMKMPGQQYRFQNDQKTPPTPSLATKLLALLIDSPHLAIHTTELTILNDEDSGYTIPEGQSARDLIPQILPHFQNLRKFVLQQSERYSPFTAPTIFQAVVKTLHLPSLVHLELKNIPINIIHHCSPSVKHLALWNPLFRDLENLSTENPHADSPLSLLSLLIDDVSHAQMSGDRNEAAIRWLLQEQAAKLDLTHLRKLRVSTMHCELTAHIEVARLLRLCAGSLEELSFSPALVAFEHKPQSYDEPIKLNVLTSLKTIHIGVQTGFWRDGSGIYDPTIWLSPLFESVPSSKIEAITFSSSYGMMPMSMASASTNYFGPDFTAYPRLDMIFGTGKFPKLRQVRFHVEEAPFYKDYMREPHTFQVRANWVKSRIRVGVPVLKRANLVRFSSSLPPYSVKLLLDSEW